MKYEKTKNKVAILGCCPSWEEMNFYDDSLEIWGMGGMHGRIEDNRHSRIDLWWDIHTLETRNEELVKWYKKVCTVPIMMQEEYEGIYNSVKYPLDEIVERYKRRYFLCTFNYQIAYAMYIGYKELHMYGVNMSMNDDLIQRWSVEYWLGRAEQSGMKIVIPESCDVLNSPKIYGYEADNTLAVHMEKYLIKLRSSSASRVKEAIDALFIAYSDLTTLFGDRKAFMDEILRRHDINYSIDTEDEG